MNKITIKSNDLEKSIQIKKMLTEIFEKQKIKVTKNLENDTDLIISIGGDGSFLKTIRDFDFPSVPVISINTGHLGFFAEFESSQIDEFLKAFSQKTFFVEKISCIKATIYSKNKKIKINAVNEIVIKNVFSRTIHLDIKVNDRKLQSFSGDAVLISTPMGSTAYNYSAGGSIVDPSLEVIQLTPIAPMNTTAYRSFTSSIILSDSSFIDIIPEFRFENCILVVSDGVEYSFEDIESIKIEKSEQQINLLRMKNYEFFKRACEKFL